MSGWWNLFSEPWVPRLGWVLIHFLWQGTALALLLAVGLRILARASAHVRYLVIGGALLLCGAMPVATWTILAPATVLPFAPVPVLPEATPVPVPSGLEAKSVVTMAAEPLDDAGMGWQERLSRGAEAALPYVVALWFGGVLILTLRLTLGWTLMQRVRLSGSPIHDALCRERFQRLLERMRIGVPVRLLESARVEVPTLIGWLRPTILVPTSVFIGLSPEQLEAILAHELAHVRRYDYLVNLFQTVIETILFYHPAVWWISRKLREERENCCDDLALEVMQDRLVYASALVQLEEGRALPLAMTASGGSLLQRIRRIAGANDRKASAWPLWVLVIGILSAVCMTGLKANENPTLTADYLITNLGRFVDGVDSMDYSVTEGDPKGDHSFQRWQEMGKLQRIETFTSGTWPDGKQATQHQIYSYDGDYGYMYAPGSDRLFRRKAPFLDLTEGNYSGLIGPLQPFQFLAKRGVRSSSGWVTLQILKSPDALAAAAARATLEPDKDRSWEGHPCLAVKISGGNDAMDSQARVDFIAYFAKDLDFYPVAYEIYKHGKISQSYHVTHFATLPGNGGKTFRYPASAQGFRYDSDSYHSSSGGGYSFELAAPSDLKINTLSKADFTIKPPAGGYIEDCDTHKLIKVAHSDASPAAEASFDMALERDRTLGTDPSVKSSTLAADAQMLLAIQKGDVVALKKVLEHAVDPNTFDPDRFYSCPVYWAVYFNQPEILKLLLEHLATGDLGPARETPLQLAQQSHPDLVPIIQEGLKRNNAVLTARLIEKLHSIHIDLPAFSGAPLPKVTQFLLEATSKAGYLDRRVNIGNMDLPPSTTITSPARPNISIWDALQTIADANKLRFDVDGSWPGCITLYPPRDEAVIHPSAKNAEDPPPAQAPSVTHADLYVSVEVVGINDSEYQAHRDPIDAAIRAGDADALMKFETYRVIDQPGCYVNYGKRMVIATGPRTLPDGSLSSATLEQIDLTPTQAGAQINFKGRVVVDTMAGSTQLSPSVVRPNIDSRQALIAMDVAPGTTTALKSPDRPGGDTTPEVLSGPYLVQSPDGKTSAVVRLFFFLKASPQA